MTRRCGAELVASIGNVSMYLLGAGSAFPPGKLSDENLAALGASYSDSERKLLSRVGVASRAVALSPESLRTLGSVDILETRKAATLSPTTLGLQAAKNALERAGISIEQVGLIVADCGTPYQTCPSEAQRIAGAFGIKIPAYDLAIGAAAVPMFFHIINSWREDRVPDYVLFVSTNTPSLHVRYGADHVAAGVFGDAAFACVVSRRHQGRWRVLSTGANSHYPRRKAVSVERHITLSEQDIPSTESLRSEVASLLSDSDLGENTYFIGPGLVAHEFASILSERGVSMGRISSTVSETGYSLGSASGAALVGVCDRAASGESVAMIHCGDGLSAKVVLMRS